MRICSFALILFLVSPLALFSGDAATFVSLGLSPDNRYFSFAQYGEQDGSGFPYAEIYLIDVKHNSYAPGGVVKRFWKQDSEPQPGGLHILLELRAEADSLFKAYNIHAFNQPEIIIPATDSERVHVEWQQKDNRHVNVLLEQQSRGEIGAYSSSAAFQLEIARDSEGLIKVGASKRFRKHVIRYDIDRVLSLKDDSGVIFVIRMTKMGFEGPDFRYMVETCYNNNCGGDKE